MSTNEFKLGNWTTSSNSAIKIALVDENAVQFSPTFTYPIFGEAEQIFGYKDLIIHLAFDALTFKPFLNVKFSDKIDDAEEIEKKLLEFLPKDDVIVKAEEKWVDAFKLEQETHELPPTSFKIGEYQTKGEKYVVYKMPLSDEYTRTLHRRVQIFSLLFIEAASYIEEDDPNWEIVWCFNKKTKQCVGYTSVYRFWKYTNASEFDASNEIKYRAKISQFVIFPPYQQSRHGSNIYKLLYNTWLKDTSIEEITVEDPNESFDDLRDRNDIQMLMEAKLINEFPKKIPVPDDWFENYKNKYKFDKRQFGRLIELLLLQDKNKNFDLQVKKRLFLKNYDSLIDMEPDEKKEALEKSFLMNEEDYKRILSKCKLSSMPQESEAQNGSARKKIKL